MNTKTVQTAVGGSTSMAPSLAETIRQSVDLHRTKPSVGATANPNIVSIIRRAVDQWNLFEQEASDCENADAGPNDERDEPDLLSIASVLSELVAPAHFSCAARDVAADVIEGILQAVNADHPIDPWPGLTRQELQVLVGGRHVSHERWAIRGMIDRHASIMVEPLTLREKFLVAPHRAWLEKDADKRRQTLAKAKAIVAAMEGRAA